MANNKRLLDLASAAVNLALSIVIEQSFVKIFPTGQGHFALGSPDGPVLHPGRPLTVLLAGHQVNGTIQASELGDYLRLPGGDCCGLCACMRVVAPLPEPEAEVIQ